MRRTIAVKRAELFFEWLGCKFSNDKDYYLRSLSLGIPDGEDEQSVMEDLQDGFYDDDIDEMLSLYQRLRRKYNSAGYYYNGKLYHSVSYCIHAAGIVVPEKIFKKSK